MPPDEAAINRAATEKHTVIVHDPTDIQKIGSFTIVCTLLNRMIGELNPHKFDKPIHIANLPTSLGSGIFVSPAIVLRGTGSVGASLCLWALGAVAAISGLLVWLELGLSIPKFRPRDENNPDGITPDEVNDQGALVCFPRNGGEKNYVGLFKKRNKITIPNHLLKLARIHICKSKVSDNMHVRCNFCYSGKPSREFTCVWDLCDEGCGADESFSLYGQRNRGSSSYIGLPSTLSMASRWYTPH